LRFALAIMLVPSAIGALVFLYAARFFDNDGQPRDAATE
jgi:hypothetical protein